MEPATSYDDLLTAYRACLDAEESIASRLKEAKGRTADAEAAIIARLEAEGQWKPGVKIGNAEITISVSEKWRATYEPEQWAAIASWAATTGRAHLIQRRLNDRAVMELVDNGTPLPDGLTVKSFPELSYRRA